MKTANEKTLEMIARCDRMIIENDKMIKSIKTYLGK